MFSIKTYDTFINVTGWKTYNINNTVRIHYTHDRGIIQFQGYTVSAKTSEQTMNLTIPSYLRADYTYSVMNYINLVLVRVTSSDLRYVSLSGSDINNTSLYCSIHYKLANPI